MQPFERLRALARWGDDDEGALVSEAAECLTGFDGDPAGLVVSCRRLLAHHPASGALWWLCARVLCAPDANEAAWEAWQLLRDDGTAARLAALLPFPHDEPVAVLGWPEITAAAFAERPDLDAITVPRRDHGGARGTLPGLRRAEPPARVVAERVLVAARPSYLLVESSAVSPDGAVVPRGAGDVIASAGSAGAKIWLVAGAGRVLPPRLFAAVLAALGAGDIFEVVGLEAVARVAGPTGLDAPDRLTRRIDCPVAPELLRLGT